MTQFINLESYIECCQYAYLFDEDPDKLRPGQGDNALPLAYRDFCQRHGDRPFLPFPTLISRQPDNLTQRTNPISAQFQTIGRSLNDGRSEKILIVREANSLVLRSLQNRYLYANVYRYWNYVSQLQDFVSGKPMIIYDLDSFTPHRVVPLTFEAQVDSPYPIPIIDTRNIADYDDLNLSGQYETIYDNFLNQLATKITEDLGISPENISNLACHLKKINLFQVIRSALNTDYLKLFLKIGDSFFNYTLSTEDFENIIYQNLPIQNLRKIAMNNPEYYFICIMNYATLKYVRDKLNREFKDSIFFPNPSETNFEKIWKQKLEKNFSLYGQHLDRISFFVRRTGEDIEISLPDQICYEGQQEATVYGQYYDAHDNLQKTFPLNQESVILPFQINGKSFADIFKDVELDTIRNEEMAYAIENPFFDESPELDVRIRFRLQPGLTPKLEVLDQKNRLLNSSLEPRSKFLEVPTTAGYIAPEDILNFRQEKSKAGIERLQEIDFSRELQQLVDSFSKYWQIPNPTLCRIIPLSADITHFRNNIFRKNKSSISIPISILPEDDDYVRSIVALYQSLSPFIEKTLGKLSSSNKQLSQKDKESLNRSYRDLLLILGNSYAFTTNLQLKFLFNQNQLTSKSTKAWDEYIRNAARVACNRDRRTTFLNLFDAFTSYRESCFYKTDEYIWGYARILLWYVDFQNKEAFTVYQSHFDKIVSYCLTLDANLPAHKSYTRDALIALIYLLSFRSSESTFVERGSVFYSRAKQLCRILSSNPILSRKANIDVPINEFFEQLLDGKATQETIQRMIEID